jgi:hypothetical protein
VIPIPVIAKVAVPVFFNVTVLAALTVPIV